MVVDHELEVCIGSAIDELDAVPGSGHEISLEAGTGVVIDICTVAAEDRGVSITSLGRTLE